MISKLLPPLGTIAVLIGATTALGYGTLYTNVTIICVVSGMFLMREFAKGGSYNGKEKINGKTVIITGANTGIGKETAKDLARRGGRIIMACRDMAKSEMAKKEIVEETGNPNVECRKLDLASFASIRAFCKAINEGEPRIDILINNAGVMMCPEMRTEEGLEMQMGVNHFGHFLMTNLLLDKIKASAPSRIIIVSSSAHKLHKFSLDDLNSKKSYSRMSAYSNSKLANLLFMRGLVHRLEGTGVTVYGLHPGVVDTELKRHVWPLNIPGTNLFYNFVNYFFIKTPVEGAQTTLRLALDPSLETVTGKYYCDCKEKAPRKAALNDELAEKLWKISEDWTHISEDNTRA